MATPRLSAAFLAVLGLGCFAAAVYLNRQYALPRVPSGLTVVLPQPVSVLLAGGDRHLAASAAVGRVLAYPADLLRPEDHEVRTRIQRDAADLNPAHEDNYYLAAATLEDAKLAPDVFAVLERANDARPYDMLPAYYLGVMNVLLFGDFTQGASWAAEAARRSDSEANRNALERMSARWAMRSHDPNLAIRMLQDMHAKARTRSLKRYLEERITAVRGLIEWRRAASVFVEQHGRSPVSLDEVRAKVPLEFEPIAAKGFAYELLANGTPVLTRARR